MKKIVWLFVILFLFYSCKPADDSNVNKPTQLVKVSQVDEGVKKVEVTLPSINGKVTFVASEWLKKLQSKKELDRVTLYRVIYDGSSKYWSIDDMSPNTQIDTIQIFMESASLRKLEYRQGFITAIYK